ncbi:MAG: GNAT family N-acetyltransferase [Clostridium sp.]|nr:GNAT family N-acetyltransferase [Clostridium sp.]
MTSTLKNVCENDRDLLFQWVNEKQCRENSLHSAAVSYAEHCEWFAEKMSDSTCQMYIYYVDETPIGQIRIDLKNGEGYISYSVANEYRGQGHGSHMLQLAESMLKMR